MSVFVDQLLLQLSDPAQLIELLAPAADTNHTRLITLLKAVYDFQFATIQGVVGDPKVLQVEPERLLLTTHRTQGTWTQTIPSYGRTDVLYEGSDKLEPIWLDLTAEVGLTLLLEVDTGAVVPPILIQPIEGFKTLDEFKAHFHFIDLQAFMAERGITTVEELREYAKYLIAQIQLQKTNMPVSHSYTLNVAILIRDAIDVAATLHDIKLARAVMERMLSYRREFDGNEVLAPYAPIVIFPKAALTGLPFTDTTLQSFFGNQGVLVLFF